MTWQRKLSLVALNLRRQSVKSANNFGRLPLLFILLLGLLTGCNQISAPEAQQPNQASSSEKMMRTNLEGQLDSWQEVSFEAKPFSSLIQHSFCEEGGDFDPDISADGKWLVFSSLQNSPNPDLYLKQVNGATATRLTSDTASEIQPCFSPSGDKVAYATNRSGNWDIWVIGIDGTNPTRLTSDGSDDIHPSWSPDGTQIVYCSTGARSRQWELWILEVAKPSIRKFIGYGLFPRWCPNAQVPKIAFQLARARGSRWFSIWTIDIVNGEARYPTEIISNIDYACICPAWSSDGAKIAYSTVGQAGRLDNDKNPQVKPAPAGPSTPTAEDIWIVDIDGRNNHSLTNSDTRNFSPAWSVDGRIFFCSDRNGLENVWSIMPHAVDFNAAAPVDLTSHPQGGIIAN